MAPAHGKGLARWLHRGEPCCLHLPVRLVALGGISHPPSGWPGAPDLGSPALTSALAAQAHQLVALGWHLPDHCALGGHPCHPPIRLAIVTSDLEHNLSPIPYRLKPGIWDSRQL